MFLISVYVEDPTRIVEPPEDLRILKGTTARFSCLAEYDKSFSNDFEILWEKDDKEIAFNDTENSRLDNQSWKVVFLSLFINTAFLPFYHQVFCRGWDSSDFQCKPHGPGCVHMFGQKSDGCGRSRGAAAGDR